MKNLFIVSSPLQVLNALEAKQYFKTTDNILLILFTEFKSLNREQIINSINQKEWNQIIQYDLKKNKNSKSSFFEQVKLIIKLKKNKYNYIFSGGFTSINKLLLANLNKQEVFLIDDGAASINQHKIELNPNITEKRKLKKRIRQYRFNIFGLKTEVKDTINLFTCFKLQSHTNEKIIHNNFSYLKQLYFTDMNINNTIYFIGQPVVDIALITEETFIAYIKKVIAYFDKPIIYIPHRAETIPEALKKLQSKNFIFQNSQGPIELIFLKQKVYPSTIVSFFSTALYTLDVIYDKSSLYSIVLPQESLKFNHKLIHDYYDFLYTTNIKKITL